MNMLGFAALLTMVGVSLARPPAGTGTGGHGHAGESVVVIAVDGLERSEGSVRIALFDDPEDFTDEPMLAAVVAPEALSAEWSARVPLGVYAVAVVHDADGDGELSTNLLGVPMERYGFSNDARGTFGPPSFEDASFVVAADTVRVAVRVR